jgi:hypothetical protein
MIDQLRGDRAQQHRLDPPVAAAPHDDEVGPHAARPIDERGRRASAENGGFDVQAGPGQPSTSFVNGPVRLSADICLEALSLDHGECSPGSTVQPGSGLDRFCHDDLRPGRPGDVCREVDGEARKD